MSSHFAEPEASYLEAKAYIRDLFNHFEIKALGSTLFTVKGEQKSRGDIETKLDSFLPFTNRVTAARPLTMWKNLYIERLSELVRERQLEVMDTIRYSNTATNDELVKLVKIITGKEDEVDIAALQHFIWQVKRKLLGRKVVWHLMPIIWGKGGSGKSYILNEFLFKPVKGFVLKSSDLLLTLSDERKYHRFDENLIAMADEMSHIEKTNVDVLKNIISEDEISGRILHKNASKIYVQRCTFIGTSNNSPSQLIYDPNGIRRFHYIQSVDFMDRQLAAQLDIYKIWCSVNEDVEEGYTIPVMDRLVEVQEGYKQQDTLEVFLEESDYRPSKEKLEEVRKLYKEYKNYCLENGYNFKMSKQQFLRQLVDKYKYKRAKEESGSTWKKVPKVYAIKGAEALDVLKEKGITSV